jgi:hypothetical protein
MTSVQRPLHLSFAWMLTIRSLAIVMAIYDGDAVGPTATTTATTILLEDFSNPIHEWITMNDPVMGGQSYSHVEIDPIKGVAHFTGQCAIVPSLDAPGFITMVTGGSMPWDGKSATFPDISACTALQLELRSNTDYSGYRLSFGRAHPWGNHFAFGYKTPLTEVTQSEDFGILTLPFTSFSSKWDDATGNIQVSCQENSHYCPSSRWLQDIKTMSFWGEGVEGMVDLEIKSIAAIGCEVEPMADINTSHTYYSHVVLTVSIVVVLSMVRLGFSKKRRYQAIVQNV